MKSIILHTISALALISATTSANAQENVMNDHTASFIEMPAASGPPDAFAEFLAGAAPLVAETEIKKSFVTLCRTVTFGTAEFV